MDKLLDNFQGDINAVDEDGSTIIGYLSKASQWEIVDKILKFDNVDIDGRDNGGNTVFMNAVAKCNVIKVEEILKRNPNINAVNKHRLTALHMASWHGNMEILEILVDQKDIGVSYKTVNKNGDTPIDTAEYTSRGRGVTTFLKKNRWRHKPDWIFYIKK